MIGYAQCEEKKWEIVFRRHVSLNIKEKGDLVGAADEQVTTNFTLRLHRPQKRKINSKIEVLNVVSN